LDSSDDEYTKNELTWVSAQPRLGFSVAYFGRGNKQLLETWKELRVSVNALKDCASDTYQKWYDAGQGKGSYTYDVTACQQLYREVAAKQEQLTTAFGILGEQPWAGWDNPESLKRKLNIPN